jgi:hypothetical protein
MKYLCTEDNKIISILDYIPNLPKSVKIIEISDMEAEELNQGKKYYDFIDKKIKLIENKNIDPMNLEINVKNERNMLLSETDWTQLPDVPEATKQKWALYRQALRDVTDQPNFPQSVTWPTKPS